MIGPKELFNTIEIECKISDTNKGINSHLLFEYKIIPIVTETETLR